MAKARQQYFADETTLNKVNTTFNLDDELLQKINEGGEDNVIEIVKVNGTPLVPDAQKAVDVPVPGVDNSLTSTSTTDALSANQGKVLYDYILQLQSRGRFLSNWNAVTGLPVTAPFGTSYTYNAGDYYVVSVVDTINNPPQNLRPDGNTYDGTHSQVYENETIGVGDVYVWDGSQWILTKNSARQIAVDSTLSTTSTNPVENRVITNELNNKQNILTAGQNIQIDTSTNTISATDTTYPNLPASQGGTDDSLVTDGEKYIWNNKQNTLQAGANITIVGDVISSTNTTYGNLPESQGGTLVSLVTDGDKYIWNHKQDTLSAGANITISGGTISATDTIYTAGTGINIDANNVISSTGTSAAWGNITGSLSSQTDLWNALNSKQDRLTAGDGINISGSTISNINRFIPTSGVSGGSVGQVLKKTGANTYDWQNESGGGGGGSSYSAGDGINITNHIITNTKPFEPGTGTAGQVLTKTANGYEWSTNTGAQEVKVWEYPSEGFSQSEMRDICTWCLSSNHSAVIKWTHGSTTAPLGVYIYGGVYSGGGLAHFCFYNTWETRGITRDPTHGDYTTRYNGSVEITWDSSQDVYALDTSTQTYSNAGNYLTVEGQQYDNMNPFMAYLNWQPATKAYVDAAVLGGGGGVLGITNDRTGGGGQITQIWVGTQTQYDAIQNKSATTIYNIIPSS